MRVRPAAPADLPAVAAIYNAGIAERTATFETRPRTVEELEGWLGGLPFLVATDPDEDVLGFARVGPYSAREAYATVGEHMVYVDPAARGRGVGRALLVALVRAARDAGLHKLSSRVFADNHASLAVHAAAGFERAGLHRRHARLDGVFRDCVLVERLLDA